MCWIKVMNSFKCFIKYSSCTLLIAVTACNAENTAVNNQQAKKVLIEQKNYVGKPHAPIEMRYKIDATKAASIGQVLNYKIYFSASVGANNLQVNYKTKEELTIQNSSLSVSFGQQSKDKNNLLELDIIPQQDGLFYIYLSATLDVNGQQQSRSFAIPVQVGELDIQALKKTGVTKAVLKQGAEQPGIISMPAVETIR